MAFTVAWKHRFALLGWLAGVWLTGCTCGGPARPMPIDARWPDGDLPVVDAGRRIRPMDSGAGMDGGRDAARVLPDVGPLSPDAACASSTVAAEVERLPVDIIWMVDNSASMESAIEQVQAGLNDFAGLIGARDLDYRVIMLSLRGEGARGSLFQVCIPPPLSGDAMCGDGERFFQVDLDVRSTQPLEQFLGTLGQTSGYLETDDRGSVPWVDLLRDGATKTIVVVTDDNARMLDRVGDAWVPGSDPVATADWFEMTPAASNPWNSRELPEGILHPRWSDRFEGYTFNALYGWGSETDPTVACSYPGGGESEAAGETYTELVRRTGGVRAQICDGASAWGPFFEAVATAVDRTSRIDCEIPIPEPPDGSFFQIDRINVFLDDGEEAVRLGKVDAAEDCDERGGWYYDDPTAPSRVVLCPASCDAAQPSADGTVTAVDVQFGCQTLPI